MDTDILYSNRYYLLASWGKRRHLFLRRKVMTNLDSVLKSRDITMLTNVHKVKGFSSSHVWMWDLDSKEDQLLKNSCFQTVVLEKTLESPLDVKEIKLVNPKGNQLWIFIGRPGAETEALILWPFDVKGWRIGKDPDAGKDCGQENGLTEDEMVGWHHWLDGPVCANFGR